MPEIGKPQGHGRPRGSASDHDDIRRAARQIGLMSAVTDFCTFRRARRPYAARQ